MALVVTEVETSGEMEEALAIRREVFVQEQKVPTELEPLKRPFDPAAVGRPSSRSWWKWQPKEESRISFSTHRKRR